jgi:hypothetical protein
MPNEPRSVTSSSEACRDRCAAVPGCIGSSWWPNGGCHISGSGASLIPDDARWGAVSAYECVP